MSAPAPPAALAGALLEVAEAQDCLLVAGPGDPLASALRERLPERLVPVAGGQVGAAVAAGVALAGRRVVVLAGDVPARLPVADLPAGAALVAVTGVARVAGACWGAGWTLVQPARAADVPALLGGALAAGRGPVVLRLPASAARAGLGGAPAAGEDPHPARFGVPRLLRAGTSGLLAASGAAAVALLVDVARLLAERGVAVQALELHTAAPGEGPGPAASDRVLLVAQRPVDASAREAGGWPGGLRAVAVPGDARGAMEAVAAHLRVGPLPGRAPLP